MRALERWEQGGRETCLRRLQEVSQRYRVLLGVEEEVDCCGKCLCNRVCSLRPP